MKQRQLKPYVETFLAFELNQLIEKPTSLTLYTASLIDLVLINSKEKVRNYGVSSSGISDHDFIYCPRNAKTIKAGRHNTICELLWEKGPTAVKCRFKTQLTAFSLYMLCNIITSTC